jgi:release factor glutamine methyltransferase
MNANLTPPALAINDWLKKATDQLNAIGIPSARLDSEIILADALEQTDRTYLHAHDDKIISRQQMQIANSNLAKRLNRWPIAYIIGYKDFYGRNFKVTSSTLIPRPESEAIIELLKPLVKLINSRRQEGSLSSKIELIDVGCGSGCLGITAKLEFSQLSVTLSDISYSALSVAKTNAKNLNADVSAVQSDLLDDIDTKPNIILANLPYVDQKWSRSPETNYEPSIALLAKNHGLSLINRLIAQAELRISPNGCLILEADPTQHSSIINYAKKHDFSLIDQFDYAISFIKLS